MPTDFTPITTREELDKLLEERAAALHGGLLHERQKRREWEKRAKENAADAETYKREARKWETFAKQNRVVIAAHESTIQKFIDKLDDVLSEED